MQNGGIRCIIPIDSPVGQLNCSIQRQSLRKVFRFFLISVLGTLKYCFRPEFYTVLTLCNINKSIPNPAESFNSVTFKSKLKLAIFHVVLMYININLVGQ